MATEIQKYFPGFKWTRMQGMASIQRLRKIKTHRPTGIAIVDEVRNRACQLNYSMVALDEMIRCPSAYFSNQCYRYKKSSGRFIFNAIYAMGGKISIDWGD